jgi:hypothetical protein
LAKRASETQEQKREGGIGLRPQLTGHDRDEGLDAR